jgi:hypothetical protein
MRSALLFVPGLVPDRPDPSAALAAVRYPALRRLLARSAKTATPCASPEALLCDLFGVAAHPDLPVAALTLLADGVEPGEASWLRADPVHLRADQAALVLVSARHFRIADDEAEALVVGLNRHFAADALQFVAPRPDRWYLRLPAPLELRTRPVGIADGCSVDPILPDGADAMRVHRWFNEAQMLLHSHAVNQAREGRGELTINSVWFWGAGALPAARSGHLAHGWGEDALLRGLCLQAGIVVAPAPDTGAAWLAQAGAGGHLLIPSAAALESLEHVWFEPLLAALRRRKLDALTLLALHEGQALRFSLTAGDLWKLWRRTTGLPGSAHA